MEFCECGSLKVNSNCTNKKCKMHVRKIMKITVGQISIIINLYERLERDYNESELKNMNIDDAKILIEDLEDEIKEKRCFNEDSEEVPIAHEFDEMDFIEGLEDEDETEHL